MCLRWWLLGEPKQKEVVYVNLTTVPIGPQELKTAFAVSESMLWWRAIMQTLETRRQDYADVAANKCGNETEMAFWLGKSNGMGEVIADLQRLRKKSVSE